MKQEPCQQEENTLASLRAQWAQAYETIQTLPLRIIAHTALQAIHNEEESRARYRIPATAPDFLDAYRLCEALTLHKQAIEHWMYVSARLWYIRERQEQPEDASQQLTELLASANEQQSRLLTAHLEMQSRIHQFCSDHRILVTVKIIDQALEVPAA